MEEKKAHILFVEDDVNLSFVTQDNLESNGFAVTACADGQAGLEAFKAGAFDICVWDVMLPIMDGFTLAREIRTLNQQVPILFLTAKSLKEDKIEGLSLGGDDYITKPFSMEELVLKIGIFLKRRQIDGPTPITGTFTIGAYTFDYNNLLLNCGEATKSLTQREADVLREFCLKENEVVKREDILNAVWGDDDYFHGRSLDVFISRLRKYLKEDPGVRINNIHGVGFKMMVETVS